MSASQVAPLPARAVQALWAGATICAISLSLSWMTTDTGEALGRETNLRLLIFAAAAAAVLATRAVRWVAGLAAVAAAAMTLALGLALAAARRINHDFGADVFQIDRIAIAVAAMAIALFVYAYRLVKHRT